MQLLGYVAVVYSFISDKVFFSMKYRNSQIIGLCIVLGFNIGVIVYRLCKK